MEDCANSHEPRPHVVSAFVGLTDWRGGKQSFLSWEDSDCTVFILNIK